MASPRQVVALDACFDVDARVALEAAGNATPALWRACETGGFRRVGGASTAGGDVAAAAGDCIGAVLAADEARHSRAEFLL